MRTYKKEEKTKSTRRTCTTRYPHARPTTHKNTRRRRRCDGRPPSGHRQPAPPLTRFHSRSPANMKPLLVTKSDPTMLIAVDRLPEKTNPDTFGGPRKKQGDGERVVSLTFKNFVVTRRF